MFIKNGKDYKVFYTNLRESEIKRFNLINLILSSVILLLVVAVCLIPQEAVEVLFNKYGWFGSVNVIALLLPLFTALYCFTAHFRSYKIRQSLTSYQLPRGLIGEKKTYSGLEIQMAVMVLFAVYEIALTVIHLSPLTAVCAVLALIVAGSAITVRIITYNALKNLSEKQVKEQNNDEIEEFYN